MALTDVIRKALVDSGQTYYGISKVTGIDHRTLGRFVNGEISPTGVKLDLLAEHFGLELVSKNRGKNRRQTSGKQ